MDRTKLDNVKLQYHLWGRKDLSDKERIVAIALASVRNEETHRCCLSQSRLAGMLNCTQQQVAKRLSALRQKNVIVSDRAPTKSLRNTLNFYFFLFDFRYNLDSQFTTDPQVQESYLVVSEKLRIRSRRATSQGSRNPKVVRKKASSIPYNSAPGKEAAERCPATTYRNANDTTERGPK